MLDHKLETAIKSSDDSSIKRLLWLRACFRLFTSDSATHFAHLECENTDLFSTQII